MGRTHPNVIKVAKQSRARPRYLRPDYGQTHVSRSVGKSGIPDDAQALFEYRRRAMGYWDDFFTRNIPTMLSKQKLACIARAVELTQDISPEMNVVVHRGGITKTVIRYYFRADFSMCFYMREDWLGMFMDKSETYEKLKFDLRSPQERAVDDYNNNRLKWVERIKFPTTIPDSPSG